MRRVTHWLALALVTAALACGPAAVQQQAAPATAPGLPDSAAWVAHVERDLVPFWTQDAALGDPVGAFPTFRCDDGRAWDPAAPCPELAGASEWIRGALGREYTRMRSRQTYFYGVAFHLTGDERLLELALAGAARIRATVEPDGSVPSWFEGGQPQPAPGLRTTQDLAYAELGLAMAAYLTRDRAVLDDVLRIKRHIFARYWREDWGMLAWTREGPEAGRQELVAQLDQVNAYMLLLAPLLDAPQRDEWTQDLRRLARLLVARYWNEELGLFWGRLDDSAERRLGGRHVDFGHSIKALWMLERIAALTGDADLAAWVQPRAARLLDRAFVAENGCWASSLREDGTLDRGLTWWTFAELDQAAATLALAEPAWSRHLPATAACWHARLVDHEHGGVWGWADPVDPARHAAKAHLWKNAYHEGEHGLVMAITAAALHGRPAELYFALPAGAPDRALRPYVFAGRVAARNALRRSAVLPGHVIERVDFAGLH